MLGRVTRLKEDKIGYILAFNEVVNNIIMPLIEEQPINLSISTDYLSQKSVLGNKRVPIFTIESPIFNIGKDKGLYFAKKVSQASPLQLYRRSQLPISDRKHGSQKRSRID